MGILDSNIEMVNNILNKELGTDVCPQRRDKLAVFNIDELSLPCGEKVSLNVFVDGVNMGIRVLQGAVGRDSLSEVNEHIAAFNMRRGIVRCGLFEGRFCVRTDIFIRPDNKNEEERLMRVLKTYLAELDGIVKDLGELIKNKPHREKSPERPKKTAKTKFDFSLFDS